MSRPEIVRELVDGKWVTTVGSSAGGGSQPGTEVVKKIPFTFATAGLATAGWSFYTPGVGELIGFFPQAWLSLTTPFDGSGTPTLTVGYLSSGVFTAFSAQSPFNATATDLPTDGSSLTTPVGAINMSATYALLQVGTDSLALQLTDGSGGDPGSTQGAGVIYLATMGVPA